MLDPRVLKSASIIGTPRAEVVALSRSGETAEASSVKASSRAKPVGPGMMSREERADAAAALTPISSVTGCSSSSRRLSSRLDSRTRSAKRTDMTVSDPRPAGRTLTIEMT